MAVLSNQEKYDAANEAYRLLVSGGQARVFVDQNGERVEYTSASAPRLYAYILALGALLESGMSSFPITPRPLRPFF